MNEEKIKIIEASYDADKELAKVKVKKIETEKEVTWALTGESFDSLIAQIVGRQLTYHSSQRVFLCTEIVGLEFINTVKIDIDNPDVNEVKEKNISELQQYHDTVDMYPFYEIQQEAIEESMRQAEEE